MLWLGLLHFCPPLAGKQGELQGGCQPLGGGDVWGVGELRGYLLLQAAMWGTEGRSGRGGGPQNDPRHFSKSQRKVMALTGKSSSLCADTELSPSQDGKGKARCRVVCIVCYSLHREKEIHVYIQIFVNSKAIS